MTVMACQTPTLPESELARRAQIIANQLFWCKAGRSPRHFHGRMVLSLALLINMIVYLPGRMAPSPQTWAACFVF
jgi:hypothetical protein